MRTLLTALVLCTLLAGQEPPPASESKPAAGTPAERFRALLDEYRPKGGGTMTDAERVQSIGRGFQLHSELATKLVELAVASPDDPIAVDALIEAVWQVNTTPWPLRLVGEDPARARAFELLQRDHLRSDKLAALCQRVSFGYCREYEPFLRAVLAASPHRAVAAQACVGLARHLTNRMGRLAQFADAPATAREFAELFGSDYIAELQRKPASEVRAEAAALFARAATEFGDETYSGEQKVSDVARAGAFEVEHLQVGCKAPPTEGRDQHGEHFALADYAGKVVLLDFWHTH